MLHKAAHSFSCTQERLEVLKSVAKLYGVLDDNNQGESPV